MRKKKDDKAEDKIKWDDYVGKPPKEALPMIYERVEGSAKRTRDWYWDSIGSKRWASLASRVVSLCLLASGAVLPILASICTEPATRLLLTQLGVASLAAAGLSLAVDRVLGWSSGWLRYMTTVTAMENATRKFRMDWANHVIGKSEPLDAKDVRQLFELAKRFEEEIGTLRSDETDKWVTEFNSSIALLGELIKSQRESAERTMREARATIEAREAKAAEIAAAAKPGALEVQIVYEADPVPVEIRLDDGPAETYDDRTWAKKDIAPGLRTVYVQTVNPPVRKDMKAVKVPAGDVAKVDIHLDK
jgi:hypothetical protein